MSEHSGTSRFESIVAELRRIGLDLTDLPGLGGSEEGLEAFIGHLRTLPQGATWAEVFPDMPDGGRGDAAERERALGPFDYPEWPRGPAVFASFAAEHGEAANTALNYIGSLGLPIYGSGLVLDRGSPHLYVILNLDAADDDVSNVVEILRLQPGILNCFQVRPDIYGDERR